MPHRRRAQEGSFVAHFDELVVKHFTHSRPTPESQEPAKPKRKRKICVHQALFERSGH